ncbi:MAG: helix-turn-helix transcriptional regulator [Steroidobacteraceae bacterium]|jgi:transcriptional regulator with XRE-family HTH domain|nr:helix-turn-helix transcriptional regulator [Steroidobacteraceae bacterium]
MKRQPLPQRIGQVLRRRREAIGVSQEDFAELIGMHRTYYSAIERGLKNVRIETLERICGALGAHIWEVLKEAEH